MEETSRHRRLDAAQIVETAELLHRRIVERFPDASLGGLAAELCSVARETADRTARIRRPNVLLRALATLVLVGVPLTVYLVEQAAVGQSAPGVSSLSDFIQTLEASLGAIVFLGAALFFVTSLETRIKRARTLDALHELRSLAHIVDMHQLEKDPRRASTPWIATPSSPDPRLDAFHLERYLDYCSEMLAILGKVAALYVQRFPDPATIAAVDAFESLTTGLSRKIWQKITLIGRDPLSP